jgi:hypothetical protein
MDKNGCIISLNELPVVDIRVIDQTLPADSSSGLFKVGAHDNNKLTFKAFLYLEQFLT